MHTTTGPFAAQGSTLPANEPRARLSGPLPVPHFVRTLFAIEALLGAMHLTVVGFMPSLHHSLTRFVSLEAEGNVPSWFSSAQLLMVGALLFVIAFGQRGQHGAPLSLLCTASAFVFLSLDEVAQIHERLGTISDALLPGGDRSHTQFARTGIWMFLLGPLLMGALAFWWRGIAPLFKGARGHHLLSYGFLLFVCSATVPEALSNLIAGSGPLLTLEVVLEELGEMAGVTLILWGLVEVCRSLRITLRFEPT